MAGGSVAWDMLALIRGGRGGLRSDVDAHVDVLLLLLLTTDSPLTVCSMPPPAAICLFCGHV